MDPDPRAIDDYIRKNRATYADQAIREQLIAAGHDPAQIDAVLQQADFVAGAAARAGWRLGWWSFVILIALGAIGAGLIWQNQQYSAGGIAAVIYAAIAAIALGVGKWISVLVDRGATGAAATLLAVIGGVGAVYLATNNEPVLAGVSALAAAGLVALLVFSRANPPAAGLAGSAVPILLWLVVTGTCYSPVFGPSVPQPTTRPGALELLLEPPLSFTGSGGATCLVYTSGFNIEAGDLGTHAGMVVSVSVATAGDPNASEPPANPETNMILQIGLNSPSGAGYASYGSPADGTFTLRPAADGISGSIDFDGLVRQTVEPPGSSVTSPGPISGTVSWTCE